MKKQIFLLVVIAAVFALMVGCSREKKAESQVKTEQHVAKKLNVTVDMLTTDKDLSCGVTLTNETIADTAIYKGQLYGFCSEDCKAKFKANPDSLIANFQMQHQ